MFTNWKKLALTDYLTGVYNLRKLYSVNKNNFKYLYFVDINNLGKINKTDGFARGNELIKRIANYLKHCVNTNGMVFRVGGDEFVILCNAKLVLTTTEITYSQLDINLDLDSLLHKASLYCYGKKI